GRAPAAGGRRPDGAAGGARPAGRGGAVPAGVAELPRRGQRPAHRDAGRAADRRPGRPADHLPAGRLVRRAHHQRPGRHPAGARGARQRELQRRAAHAAVHAAAARAADPAAAVVARAGDRGRVSSAMEIARLYAGQTEMSEALQRSLLPAKEKEPDIPGVDHAVFYRPADERTVVGGDFYDVFATDGRWCFAIGDVCGTGPEAAAVTGLARHTLRALARESFSPSHIMDRLNLAILDENTSTRFLTMLYGEMTPLG